MTRKQIKNHLWLIQPYSNYIVQKSNEYPQRSPLQAVKSCNVEMAEELPFSLQEIWCLIGQLWSHGHCSSFWCHGTSRQPKVETVNCLPFSVLNIVIIMWHMDHKGLIICDTWPIKVCDNGPIKRSDRLWYMDHEGLQSAEWTHKGLHLWYMDP